MEAVAEPVWWVEYEARRSATASRLRAEAEKPTALVREVAKIVRWLNQEQPIEAIGPIHGIYSDGAYQFRSDAYLLRAIVHTATGKPAIQLVRLDGNCEEPVHHGDAEMFERLVDRIVRGRVLTSWEAHDCFSVAIKVPVHLTLVRAVTHNYRTTACSGARARGSKDGCPIFCGDCPYRAERQAMFIVPAGWHI